MPVDLCIFLFLLLLSASDPTINYPYLYTSAA